VECDALEINAMAQGRSEPIFDVQGYSRCPQNRRSFICTGEGGYAGAATACASAANPMQFVIIELAEAHEAHQTGCRRARSTHASC